MKKLLKSKRRGSAIPLAVVAIIILLAMGVGLLSLGFNGRVYTIRNASGIKARCAADAGLAMALFEMNKKLQVKPFDEGILPHAINVKLLYSDQVCSYRVTGNLGSYVITSFGQSGRARRSVRATIGLQSPFNDAILTKESLVLKSGTTIDGYNSDDLTETDIESSIGSQSSVNDSVVLNNGVTVEGDVFVAPGADLDTAIKDLGATVTGDKCTGDLVTLPPVTAPPLPNIGTDILSKGATKIITPADNGVYTSIGLASTGSKLGILEIDGGNVVLHVTGDIKLGQDCEIIVKDGSTLKIYSDGDIACANGSSINSEAPPEAASTLQLFATGEGTQFFDVKAKSEWTGTIYGPEADVVLYAGGDVYGSIVANDFEFKAGGDFHYDKALQKKNTVDDDAVVFVVNRWYESSPFYYPDSNPAEIMPVIQGEPL